MGNGDKLSAAFPTNCISIESYWRLETFLLSRNQHSKLKEKSANVRSKSFAWHVYSHPSTGINLVWTFLEKMPVNRYSPQIWHQPVMKGMGPPKTASVNQWVHWSYLLKLGWGFNYRNVSCHITQASHNNLWKATRWLLLSLVGLPELGVLHHLSMGHSYMQLVWVSENNHIFILRNNLETPCKFLYINGCWRPRFSRCHVVLVLYMFPNILSSKRMFEYEATPLFLFVVWHSGLSPLEASQALLPLSYSSSTKVSSLNLSFLTKYRECSV